MGDAFQRADEDTAGLFAATCMDCLKSEDHGGRCAGAGWFPFMAHMGDLYLEGRYPGLEP
jgi:hypothetical protein